MEENKLYIKLGANNPDELPNTIQGYFICFSKKPYKAKGCEFDIQKDFENAILIKNKFLDEIIVGKSQYINGQFLKNEES